MDLSFWECQGFKSLGAMGSDRYADHPSLACRPFDRDTDGFIYGENCGVIVLERSGCRRFAPIVALARDLPSVSPQETADPHALSTGVAGCCAFLRSAGGTKRR